MGTFFRELIFSNSRTSSARTINLVGAVVGSGLLIYDTILNQHLSPESFSIYLLYCAGTYTSGKYLDYRNSINQTQTFEKEPDVFPNPPSTNQ